MLLPRQVLPSPALLPLQDSPFQGLPRYRPNHPRHHRPYSSLQHRVLVPGVLLGVLLTGGVIWRVLLSGNPTTTRVATKSVTRTLSYLSVAVKEKNKCYLKKKCYLRKKCYLKKKC